MSLKDIDEAIELQKELISREKEKLEIMKQMRELAAKKELRKIMVTPDMIKSENKKEEDNV